MKFFIAFAICILAALASRSSATIIDFVVCDNFDADPPGSTPAGWVVNQTGGSATVADIPDATDHSVALIKTASADTCSATRTFTPQSGIVSVEARVQVSETNSWFSAPYIESSNGNALVSLAFTGGFICSFNGSVTIPLAPVTTGRWYNLRIMLDTGAQTFDVYVDGRLVGYDIAFRSPGPDVEEVMFSIGAKWTGQINFDDVIVSQAPVTTSYLFYDNFSNPYDIPGAAPAGWVLDTSGGTVAITSTANTTPTGLGTPQIVKTNPANAASATANFTPTSGKVIVQANLRTDDTGTTKTFDVRDSKGDSIVTLVFSSGSLSAYNGSALVSVEKVSTREWYNIRLLMDTGAGTFDLYVDGRLMLQQASFRNTGNGTLAALFIGINATYTGTLYFDKVMIYVNPIPPAPPSPVFDVDTYGAVGDGATVNTTAIQNAINACAGTGGSVYLHNGTFMCGTLTLQSNMTLWVDRTAILRGVVCNDEPSTNANYPSKTIASSNVNFLPKSLLFSDSASNLTVDGGGTLDGNSTTSTYWSDTAGIHQRPDIISFNQGSNITIRNLYVTMGANWNIRPLECDNVTIQDVSLYDTTSPNRDGIDVCDCSNVLVERCSVFTEDDAFCMKSGITRGVVNMVLRDCSGASSGANGIKLGTSSYGAFTNILVQDMFVKNCYRSAVTVDIVDGADTYNVTMRRIKAYRTHNPFFMVLGDRGQTTSGYSHKLGSASAIKFESFASDTTLNNLGSAFSGYVESGTDNKIYNLLFHNVNMAAEGGVTSVPGTPPEYTDEYPEYVDFGTLPAWGYYLRHIDGVTFDGCSASISPADARSELATDDVLNEAIATPAPLPPTMTSIASQPISDGTGTAPLAFTVGDVNVAPGNLIVTDSSSNPALVPDDGIVLGGSGANRTVTVTPAADQLGTATISVNVADGTSTTTTQFVVTVNGDAMQTWRFQNFGTTANAGAAADTAVPYGNGVPNLLEFATNTNPNPGNPMPGQAVLDGSNIEFSYTRSIAAMNYGVTYAVQWSDTLAPQSWSNTGVTEVVTSQDATTQQVLDTVPASSCGQTFVRLQVTNP